MKTRHIERTALTVTLLLILAALILEPQKAKDWKGRGGFIPGMNRSRLECVIDFGGPVHTSKGLLSGYCYWLFTEFAKSTGADIHIILAGKDENYLDSLAEGTVDIVAFPYLRSMPLIASLQASEPIDSVFTWYVRKSSRPDIRRINRWIAGLDLSTPHRLFMKVGNPYKRRSDASWISPYDELFREWGEKTGLDWRLLAAIGWQESHWRIDIESRRGARGIMQVMPVTARRYGTDDLTDPASNIEAGAKLLKELSRSFPNMKFALAAYNAGGNRVRSYIRYAALHGADASSWDQVAELLPQMGRDSLYLADSLGIKRIGYGETVQYVRRVLSLYEEFKRIRPNQDERSAQDQPVK